jgi:hypothetical protein
MEPYITTPIPVQCGVETQELHINISTITKVIKLALNFVANIIDKQILTPD